MKKMSIALPLLAAVLSACSTQNNVTTTPSTSPIYETPSPMTTSSPMSLEQVSPSPQGIVVGNATLTPDKTIADNIASADILSSASAAINTAGLKDMLQSTGPYTIFVPTNDALGKLPKSTVLELMKPANKSQVAQVLKMHVVSGKYMTSDLKDGEKLKSLAGKTLTISMKNGNLLINNATVLTPDITAKNGVIYIVDAVIQ